MIVRYTPQALADLDAIVSWLRERSPQGAAGVERAIMSKIMRLEHFPLSGSETDRPGILYMPVVKYPYLIFFRTENEQVEILHIRHGARGDDWSAD